MTAGDVDRTGTYVVLRTYTNAWEFDAPDGDVAEALVSGRPRLVPLPDDQAGRGDRVQPGRLGAADVGRGLAGRPGPGPDRQRAVTAADARRVGVRAGRPGPRAPSPTPPSRARRPGCARSWARTPCSPSRSTTRGVARTSSRSPCRAWAAPHGVGLPRRPRRPRLDGSWLHAERVRAGPAGGRRLRACGPRRRRPDRRAGPPPRCRSPPAGGAPRARRGSSRRPAAPLGGLDVPRFLRARRAAGGADRRRPPATATSTAATCCTCPGPG